LRTRWRLEQVVPADDVGNRGFGLEVPLGGVWAPKITIDKVQSAGDAEDAARE
jgi:hypothetical protein